MKEHLNVPLEDLQKYGQIIIFFGHQLVLHFDSNKKKLHHNEVDGKISSCSSFWIVLSWNEFIDFEKKLKKINKISN